MSVEFCHGCSRDFDTDWFEECPHCEGETWAGLEENTFMQISKTVQLFSPEKSALNGSPERACQRNILNLFAPSRASSA